MRIYTITEVPVARGQSAVVVVYGPKGTKLKRSQVGRIRRVVRAVGKAVRSWEIDSVTVGMPPLTIKIQPKKK